MAKKIKKPILDTPLSAVDLENLHDQGVTYFESKWTSGDENERYQKVENWTEDQKAKIKSQDRQPYSMAAMTTKLNTIKGTQRQARTQFDVTARVDPKDEGKAIFAKLALRDAERSSDFKYIESEIFDSGLAVKYGAGEAYVDYSKLEPRILFRKLDYRNVVWDTNSTSYDVWENGLWLAKIDRVYRWQLRGEYGSIVDELSEEEGRFGRPKTGYYVRTNTNGVKDLDIISKFTHYQKVMRTYYHVIHPDSMGLLGLQSTHAGKYETQKEAERELRKLNAVYIANGLDLEGSVEEKDEEAVDRYVFANSRILEYEKTDLCPIKIYRCFHFEDDFWSFMDMLKSPQIFMDRLISQIDYTFGTDIKNVYQLNVNALAEMETPESAKDKAQRTGGVILTNSNEPAIQAVQSKGVNPQWLQVLAITQQFVEDFAGGRSFQGLSEGSGESGKAINLKKQQGAILALLPFDNLARWKKSLGEVALKLIQRYDTVERQIKVQGDEFPKEIMEQLKQTPVYTPSKFLDGGYVAFNRGMAFLEDADFELTVTQATLTESEKEFKYMSLMEAARNMPLLQQSPTYILYVLENDPNMPREIRRAIQQEIQGRLQQEQEMNQQKLNIDKAKVLQDGLISQQNKGAQNARAR